MLYRIATVSEISLAEFGAFFTVVANYAGKRVVNARAHESELEETVADLGQKVQALQVNVTTALNRTAPTVGVGMPRR